MKTYSFEKLDCWQNARELSRFIYIATKNFPPDEKFGFTSQIRRCTTSIAANIAEGSSRSTPKDQAYFSTVAYSSTIELLNHLIIANDLLFISKEDYEMARQKIEIITSQIAALRKSQLTKTQNPKH